MPPFSVNPFHRAPQEAGLAVRWSPPRKGTSLMTSFSPSHLDVIEQRFLAMTAGPQPLTLDCAALGCGLPDEDLPLDQGAYCSSNDRRAG